jgi:hypothetical protein
MQKYELSKTDFEVLDKLMANVLGHRTQQVLTVNDIAAIEFLKEKFGLGFSATIEIEE